MHELRQPLAIELKRDTQGREELKPTHILVRALRRGFAIYIEDAAFSVYRRVVQRLAQQGKLAIVFSDVSLAYGVNMPFRTVMFCGDEGGLLTPLLAQQMAGRAGPLWSVRTGGADGLVLPLVGLLRV